jgi:hypothetical protein
MARSGSFAPFAPTPASAALQFALPAGAAPGTAGAASRAAGATRGHCRFPARMATLSARFRFLSGSLRAETRAAQPATSPGIQSTLVGV